ncbi:MAG TPA: hypothetical protein PKC28_00805 [Bdellovibrionales bacterium]|nr:hypothetical protein [Bdellovibrionales bacterium]
MRLLFFATLLAISGLGHARPDLSKATRDPRQLSIIVSDLDESYFHGIGHYRVRRMPNPEVPGFGSFSGMPEEVAVPVYDFDGNLGLKVSELLGEMKNGQFKPSAAVQEVTLRNGIKFRPGFYYFDRAWGYAEFREREDAETGWIESQVAEKLASGTPFLMEGAVLLSPAFDEKWADRVSGAILTKRGASPQETRRAIELIRDELAMGRRSLPDEAFVNLQHRSAFEFADSKHRYNDKLYQSLSRRMMKSHEVPHFLIMIENDRRMLEDIDAKMQSMANRGVFANPVVPILVNLVEPEVFANPAGIDWDRSRLESVKPVSRVTVYWPNDTERTDRLERVFELALGLSRDEALKLYKSKVGAYACRDLLVGKFTREARP